MSVPRLDNFQRNLLKVDDLSAGSRMIGDGTTLKNRRGINVELVLSTCELNQAESHVTVSGLRVPVQMFTTRPVSCLFHLQLLSLRRRYGR